MEKMTEKQEKIFLWIRSFIELNKFPPTRQEIGSAFSIAPNGVQCHLEAIERKGFLTLTAGISRGISINNTKAQPILSFKADPGSDRLELFVDSKLLTTCAYEENPEYSFHEFEKIFWAGYNHGER